MIIDNERNRLILSVILSVFTLFAAVFLSCHVDVVENLTYRTLISLDVGAALVSGLFTIILLIDRHYDSKSKAFAVILYPLSIVFSADGLALMNMHHMGLYRVADIFLSIEYMAISMMLGMTVYALKLFFGSHRPHYYLFVRTLGALCIAELLVILQNFVSRNVWDFSDGGIVYGPLYPVLFLIMLVQNLIYIIACIRLSTNLKRTVMLTTLIIFSPIVIILMYPRYFITIHALAVMFPVLVIMPVVYNLRSEQLIMGRREMKLKEGSMKISFVTQHQIDRTTEVLQQLEYMPSDVAEAIGKFRKYMWDNFESFNNPSLIPLSKELEHAEAFIYLEKLRYKDRLRIETDLQNIDIELPSLCLQILVENSIRHGVSKRPDGGTVRISSEISGGYAVITVEDDGVGFDVHAPRNQLRSHVGIDNLAARLGAMDGRLEIESTIGTGTTARIFIPYAPPEGRYGTATLM